MSTETEAIPQATTAECGACGQTGQRAEMTWDGAYFYCGNELAALEDGDLQRFVAEVEACTLRQIEAGAARKESAQQAAEPVEETTADQDAETGPAKAQAAAEDVPEGVTDANAEVNT